MNESKTTHPPLTLDNHVARIANEGFPSWWNAEARRGAGVEARTTREEAFKAGIRAALSGMPDAVAARASST